MEECSPGLPAPDMLKRPAFPPDEYHRRLREVRRRMSAKGIECLLIHSFPNICYLTGLETVATHKYFMLAVPVEGDTVLLCQTFESHNALLSGCACEIVTYGLHADYIAATRDLARRSRLDWPKLRA